MVKQSFEGPAVQKAKDDADLQMATTPGRTADGEIDSKNIREVIKSIQNLLVETMVHVSGKLRVKEFAEKELTDNFAKAVHGVFGLLTDTKGTDSNNLISVLPNARADLEREVQNALKVHVSGFLRTMHGSVKDSIFDFAGSDESRRNELSQLRTAYVIVFIVQYLEHDQHLFGIGKSTSEREQTPISQINSLKRIAQYLSVDEAKMLLDTGGIRSLLQGNGIEWSAEKVEKEFAPSTRIHILETCTRTAKKDIPNYARSIDILEDADNVVRLMSKPPYNNHDEKSIRYILSLSSARQRISQRALANGDPLPRFSKIVDIVHKYADPEVLAGFINDSLRKRSEGYSSLSAEDYKSFKILPAEAHNIITHADVRRLSVWYADGFERVLESFLDHTQYRW
ncbi:MAG: hypothetical protein AAB947_00020 [Patescibacteria group bacterium]